MNPDKWADIKAKIRSSFKGFSTSIINGENEGETIEIMEFETPAAGRVKIHWITKPKVLDKKTHYSNRIGGGTVVDYILSEDEKVNTMEVYKWNEALEDWEIMEAEKSIFSY